MSIMDLFRGAKPMAGLQEAERNQPANQDMGTTPPANQPSPEATPADPMDKFKDLWAAPKEGDPVPQNFDPSKMFQIDPAKIQEEVGKINFAGSVTPDMLQKIQAGGADATQAFAEAMNKVAQQTFAQSMLASAKLVEGALTQANNSLDSRIESRAKQMQASNSLRESNPALSHSSAAPLVAALESQLAQKHPTASPTELTKLAQEYLSTFANVAAGKKEDTSSAKKAPDDVDWEKFFGASS